MTNNKEIGLTAQEALDTMLRSLDSLFGGKSAHLASQEAHILKAFQDAVKKKNTPVNGSNPDMPFKDEMQEVFEQLGYEKFFEVMRRVVPTTKFDKLMEDGGFKNELIRISSEDIARLNGEMRYIFSVVKDLKDKDGMAHSAIGSLSNRIASFEDRMVARMRKVEEQSNDRPVNPARFDYYDNQQKALEILRAGGIQVRLMSGNEMYFIALGGHGVLQFGPAHEGFPVHEATVINPKGEKLSVTPIVDPSKTSAMLDKMVRMKPQATGHDYGVLIDPEASPSVIPFEVAIAYAKVGRKVCHPRMEAGVYVTMRERMMLTHLKGSFVELSVPHDLIVSDAWFVIRPGAENASGAPLVNLNKLEDSMTRCPECKKVVPWPRKDSKPFCPECGGKIGNW